MQVIYLKSVLLFVFICFLDFFIGSLWSLDISQVLCKLLFVLRFIDLHILFMRKQLLLNTMNAKCWNMYFKTQLDTILVSGDCKWREHKQPFGFTGTIKVFFSC